MKKIYVVIIPCLIFLSSCLEKSIQNSGNDSPSWKLIYRNDKNGEPVYGNKEELIEAIRNGYPIRVGWASRRKSDSTKSVEHVSDVEFITIANTGEVFAQITPFLAQRPDLNSDTLSMTLLPIESSWILGTNGLISSVSKDFQKDTVSTSPPRLFGYGLSWFVQHRNDAGSDHDQIPLWD